MLAELAPSEASVQTFRTPSTEPARPADRAACLVYIYPTGPSMGSRYALDDEPVFIGRADECAVRNTDGSVSRHHAKIARRDDGAHVVTDLGSTNGTFVNDQRKQAEELRDGDYLRVGNCIYRYLDGGNIETEYHEEIYRLTVLDGLTQVHNRRYLTEFLDREVVRSTRYGRPLALVLFDVDHFKSINDRYGHLVGDLTLRELCARVRPLVQPDELLARYGGEEFAVVLPEAQLGRARAVAEQIRAAVEKRPFAFNGVTYPVTVSLGVAVASAAKEPPAELIGRADKHLYQAKAAGRNRVVSG